MTAPHTLALRERIKDASVGPDARFGAVVDRTDQIEDEAASSFNQMRTYIADCFADARREARADLRQFRQETLGRFERVDDKLDRFKTESTGRFARLEGKVDRFQAESTERFKRLEDKVDGFQAESTERFKRLEDKVDGFQAESTDRLKRLESKIDRVLGRRVPGPRPRKRRR